MIIITKLYKIFICLIYIKQTPLPATSSIPFSFAITNGIYSHAKGSGGIEPLLQPFYLGVSSKRYFHGIGYPSVEVPLFHKFLLWCIHAPPTHLPLYRKDFLRQRKSLSCILYYKNYRNSIYMPLTNFIYILFYDLFDFDKFIQIFINRIQF